MKNIVSFKIYFPAALFFTLLIFNFLFFQFEQIDLFFFDSYLSFLKILLCNLRHNFQFKNNLSYLQILSLLHLYMFYLNVAERRYTRRDADGKFGVIFKSSTASNRPLKNTHDV